MSRQHFTAVLFVLSAAFLAIAQAPPPPNPQQPVDYIAWINERLGTPAARETGHLYEAATDLFVSDEAAEKVRLTGDWSEADRKLLHSWVDRNEAYLSAIAKAAEREKCFMALQSESGALVDAMMPRAPKLRMAARLLAERAVLRAADGQGSIALDDLATILQLGDHLAAQPVVMWHLVGINCSGMATSALGKILTTPDAKLDCTSARTKLARLATPSPSARAALQGERLMHWDIYQRLLKDDDGDGRIDRLEARPEIELSAIRLPTPQSLDQLQKQVDQFFDRYVAAAAQPYATVRAKLDTMSHELEAPQNILARALMPGLERVIMLSAREKSQRRALWLVLQLFAYHAQHNRWPEQLELALPPGDKDGVRDPLTDKPYGYRVVDGQPLLYTLGSDGKDNGGRMSPAGTEKRWDTSPDYVFWPPAE